MDNKKRWDLLVKKLSNKFSSGENIEIEGILYLIGLQQYGNPHQRFRKDDNINLIHIGICTVLEPYGYYEFERYDEQGWPHFKLNEMLPKLKSGEQTVLIKTAIIEYFSKLEYIS
ncbi:MAG: hypothetical protein OXC03_00700 [Flavobacteriaceae bacterium]|nr:hypothetical protein [Flavobacteriaceae bacterium]